jgi:3'-phosphoadenosine 5'-phosphosulfate sulfotransferase (PAPS reductase)/FAD synthetase
MKQLTLFPQEQVPTEAPVDPLALLRSGAALVLSISGGKDSDAMSHYLLDLRASEGWTGEVVMLHADLGRAEWHNTPEYVREFAQRKGVELHVVHHSHMDLIDRIWQRYHQNPDRPCWPSSKIRYCTSDFKTSIAARFLRNHFPTGNVICALGFRKSESPARKKRDAFSLRKDASAPTKGRFVYNWLPIHHWTEDDVWQCIRQHGNDFHEAYKHGNQRLSCALCVLASENDLLNGATHNPEIYREYCRIEAVTGYSFRQNFWLSDIKPELLDHETLTAIQRHKEAKR